MNRVFLMLVLFASGGTLPGAQSSTTIGRVVQGTHASVIVLEVASGTVIAQAGDLDVTAVPGSVLKPFVLHAALTAHILGEHATINCPGTLTIAGHNLACTHPRDVTVLDARQALANSCNAYFASLAEQMPESVLVHGLRSYGLEPSGTAATPEQRALMTLGVVGIRVSPRQLAMAYRRLAVQMESSSDRAAAVVRDGMVQSVEAGMAHAAHIDGMTVAGKTGSMHDASDPRGHGWFAGIVGAGASERVVVIYLPGGNGNDAAVLARRWMEENRRGVR